MKKHVFWLLVVLVATMMLATTVSVMAYDEGEDYDDYNEDYYDSEDEDYEEKDDEDAGYDDEESDWIVERYAKEYGDIVIVDLDDQHVYLCLDGEIIEDSDCVSGDSYDSPTPTGLYEVWYKESDYYMQGRYYTAYATFFNGGIAIHDADAWRDEYGDSIYEGGGSHGCVNVPRWFAEIVYNDTWEGMPVYVF